MDDLERDLATLLRTRADATEVPHLPLDGILARGEVAAGRGRRRNGLIALIAVAAVVAVIAIPVGIQSLRSSSPGPSAPATPPPSSDYQVLSFINSVSAPSAVAVDPDGDIATLWSRCGAGSGGQPCQVAWMMQSGVTADDDPLKSATSHVGWAPSDARLSVSGSSFVVTSYASDQGFVLDEDGTTTQLRLLDASMTQASELPGASVVPHSQGLRLVNTKTGTWTPVVDAGGKTFDQGVIADETFWGERVGKSDIEVEVTRDGDWQGHGISDQTDITAGPIAGDQRSAAAAAFGPGGDTAWLLVTTDGGHTFTDLPGSALPFDAPITEMAATTTGLLFVSTSKGTLYYSTDDSWTSFKPFAGISGTVLQPLDDNDVLAWTPPNDNGDSGLAVLLRDGNWTGYGPSLADLKPPLPSESPSANATPTSLDDLPMGALPKVPYLRDGLVVMNGIPTQAPPGITVLAAAGIVVLEGKRDSQGETTFWVYRGNGWVKAPWLGTHGQPALDDNGRYAGVLSYPDASTTRVTLVDPQTSHEFGHIDLDAPYASCCGGGQQITLLGVDIYGNVYWDDANTVWRWAPHKEATQLGDAGDVIAVNALGIVMGHPHEPGMRYVVRADSVGSSVHVDQDENAYPSKGNAWSGDPGVYSNDGHRVLIGSTVIDVETGAQYPMALPPQMAVTPLGFEDDDTVEMLVHNSGAVYPADHPASILRCFVATQTCERAENLPDLQRTQFPERF